MNDGYHELNIVAVSRSDTGTKKSKRLGFVLARNGKTATLKTGNPRVSISDKLVVTPASPNQGAVEIWQNSRIVATAENGKSVAINSALLAREITPASSLQG